MKLLYKIESDSDKKSIIKYLSKHYSHCSNYKTITLLLKSLHDIKYIIYDKNYDEIYQTGTPGYTRYMPCKIVNWKKTYKGTLIKRIKYEF